MTFSWLPQSSIVPVFRIQREILCRMEYFSESILSTCVCRNTCPYVDRDIKKLEFISIALTKLCHIIFLPCCTQWDAQWCCVVFLNKIWYLIFRPIPYSTLLLSYHLASLLYGLTVLFYLLNNSGNLKSLGQALYRFMIGPGKVLATFFTRWDSH